MSSITFTVIKDLLDHFDTGININKNKDNTVFDIDKMRDFGISYKDMSKGGASIIKLTKSMLVEPSFIVSKSLRNDEHTLNVLKTLTNLFTSYYTQAFHVLANVQRIEPTDVMNVLGTASLESDEVMYKGLCLDVISEENMPFSLPLDMSDDVSNLLEISLESKKNKKDKNTKLKKETVTTSITKLDEKMNMILGRNVDISVKTNNADFTIPIVIRAGIKFTDFSVISELISLKGKSKKLQARLDKWRSGGITFFKDFIFATDLIKQYKNTRIKKDSEEVIQLASQRASGTVSSFISNGRTSFGGLYSGLVINEEEALKLESDMGGKLTKYSVRQEIMESSQSLFIVVLDREWERANFYTRDLNGYSDIAFSALKGSDSKDSLLEMFKSFSSGVPPTL